MPAHLTIADLPEKYRQEAWRQLGDGKPLGQARAEAVGKYAVEIVPTPSAKPRIRQNSEGLNKTEAAFYEHLKRTSAGTQDPANGYPQRVDVLAPQTMTLRLGNGVRYTPDFATVTHAHTVGNESAAQTLRFYEVKGYMRDDAAVKIKVAASLFPFWHFYLVTKAKGGAWNIDPVFP